jgi:uncharacterized protein YukE
VIPVSAGNGAGTTAFPDPPQGSPGEITAVARTLSNAADDLEGADGGLRGASGALASDWQGYAANAYHTCSEGLAQVAHAGAQTFRECAHAVSGYAAALDNVQSELRRLKALYDDAIRRQAAANSLSTRLDGAVTPTTKPADAHRLQTQATTANNQAVDAGTEADGYAGRATAALGHFKAAASGYEQTLNGVQPGQPSGPLGSPFSTTGHPGTGFGTPYVNFNLPGPTTGGSVPGGLNQFDGVIPVGNPWHSPIPGYGFYKDATTPEIVPDNDLTNLVLFLAPLAAGPAGDLGESALRQLAESMGFGVEGHAAVDAAEREAFDETLSKLRAAEGKSSRLSSILNRATQAGNQAAATTQVAQHETTARWADIALDAANRAGVLPQPAKDVLSEIIHRGWIYSSYTAATLRDLQSRLIAAGGTASRAAANAIGAILRSGR